MCQITVTWHKIGETATEFRVRNIHPASPVEHLSLICHCLDSIFLGKFQKKVKNLLPRTTIFFSSHIGDECSRENRLFSGPKLGFSWHFFRQYKNPKFNSNFFQAAVNKKCWNPLTYLLCLFTLSVCLWIQPVLQYSIQKRSLKEEKTAAFESKFWFWTCMEGSCLLNSILKTTFTQYSFTLGFQSLVSGGAE